MSFEQAVKSCLRKYVTFSGRAQRSEYWWWALFVFLSSLLVGVVEGLINGFAGENVGILNGAFSLATFLPGLSVLVRRLHDTNRSGWWFWIIFVPFVGWILLLVWLISKGTDGPNDCGPDPLSGSHYSDGNGGDESGMARSNIPNVKR